MLALLLCAIVAIHLTGYMLYVRQTVWGRTEKGIFLYHIASFTILLLIAAGVLTVHNSSEDIANVFVGVGLHAIYSLTFLELWSLSQGSFSYTVLSRVKESDYTVKDLVAKLGALGASKKADRITVLSDLGLIRRTRTNSWAITPRGKIAAKAIKILLWLPATTDRG